MGDGIRLQKVIADAGIQVVVSDAVHREVLDDCGVDIVEVSSERRDAAPEVVCREVVMCHQQAGNNFIVAAGCEIVPDTAYENVRVLEKYVLSHPVSPIESRLLKLTDFMPRGVFPGGE